MSGRWIEDEIREVRFTPVRIREGYDMGEVDAFLDQVVAVARRDGDVSALVSGARFHRVRWREGYAISEVDAFLDMLAPGARPSAPPVVAQESRGLLGRLFGA